MVSLQADAWLSAFFGLRLLRFSSLLILVELSPETATLPDSRAMLQVPRAHCLKISLGR
jgi:hypothetical protein